MLLPQRWVAGEEPLKERLGIVDDARRSTRCTGRNSFTIGLLNPHGQLRRGRAVTAKPKPDQHAPRIEPRNGVIVVASCRSEEVLATPGYQIVTLDRGVGGSDAKLLFRCRISLGLIPNSESAGGLGCGGNEER